MKTEIGNFDQFSWVYDYIDVDVNVQNRVLRKSIVFDSPMRHNAQPNRGCKIPIVLLEFRTLSANQCSFGLSFQSSILIQSPNPDNTARDQRVPCTVPVRQQDLTFRLDFAMSKQSVTSCPNDWLGFRVTRYSPAMLVQYQSVYFSSSWVQYPVAAWEKEAHPTQLLKLGNKQLQPANKRTMYFRAMTSVRFSTKESWDTYLYVEMRYHPFAELPQLCRTLEALIAGMINGAIGII